MRLSKLFIFLLVLVAGFAAVAQRRKPAPLAPAGFFLGRVAGVLGGQDGIHHTVVLVSDEDARGGAGAVREALLITVGGSEGAAIALGLAHKSFVRPLTHDLMFKIFNRAGLEVRGVFIHSLQSDTFFARLELSSDGEKFSFDCRPSDAMALAVRSGAPVWIERKLFEKAAMKLDPRAPVRPPPPSPRESL